MNHRKFISLSLLLAVCAMVYSQPVQEVGRVIERYAMGRKVPVKVSVSLDKRNGCDVFETSVKMGSCISTPVVVWRPAELSTNM